jgi:hypothetical protein
MFEDDSPAGLPNTVERPLGGSLAQPIDRGSLLSQQALRIEELVSGARALVGFVSESAGYFSAFFGDPRLVRVLWLVHHQFFVLVEQFFL